MSFRCQKCGRALKDGQKPVMVVTDTRSVSYPAEFDEKGRLLKRPGQGQEIAREMQMCRSCAGIAGRNIREIGD